MPVSFLSLPAEIRNEIYSYLLVRREHINPWIGDHDLHPNILFTNTAILHEARTLLYGHNCFDLTWEPGRISEFLDNIGFINASHLQCIRIDFPRLRDLEDEVSLEEGSLQILGKIQSHCSNIRKLVIASESTNTMEVWLYSFGRPTIARTLALVAARFGEISSIQEIVVEVYEESPSSDIRRGMESHGWILKVVEPVEVEEWDVDRSWGDYEDDEYPNDDYDDDDYDIDNDSDFWRRAAD